MSQANTSLQHRVAQIVRDEVAPLLEMDATGIEVVSVEDGVVQVRFSSACGGCPGSVHAVIMALEEELRRRVPEVEYLEAVP